MSERARLKRSITLTHLIGIEVGQSVGAGIFALTGLAIAYTGGSTPLAFICAAIPVGVAMSVLAMLGSAAPASGGTYLYGSRLFSPVAAFTGVFAYIIGALFGMFPLYALTGVDFLRMIFPSLPRIPTAIGLLAFFYLTNVFGAKLSMWVQAVLVGVLLSALIVFTVIGFPRVVPGAFSPLFPGGIGGFAVASALLTFTVLGANAAVELGDEIVDPRRNIPRSFLVSIPIVVVLYVLIGVVTVGSGISGGDESPGLAAAAGSFMSGFPFWFFILGGGFLAVMTTLNATYLWGTKSLIVIAEDGLIPKSIARVGKRFGTPHRLLTIIFLISSASLAFAGARVETFAVFASLGGIIILIPVMGAAMGLEKKRPDLYRESSFRLSGWYYRAAPIVGMALSAVIVGILLIDLSSHRDGFFMLSVFVTLTALGAAYAGWRIRKIGGIPASF